MPRWGILGFAKFWARTNLWLLKVVCGVGVEGPRMDSTDLAELDAR